MTSERMSAYRMVAWASPPELVEVDVPRPGPGQLLVRVAGNGLCHSDLTMMALPAEIGTMLGWRMPFTLGHEIGGWIESTGPAVDGFGRGDPVALVSPHSCGRCPYCRRGQDSLCEQELAGRGYGRDGGLAGYVLVDGTRAVIKLATLDPAEAAPLTDAGATTYHAVKRALPKLVPGSTAVVIGAGGLGMFAVQFARVLSPARVIAVDPNPVRRDIAREIGAHQALDGVDRATAAALRDLTAGEGAEVVIDLVGTDATIEAGLAALRKGGTYALVGAAGGTLRRPWYGHLPREAEIFTFQGSTIADAHEVIALAEAGLVRSAIDRFPLDRVADAYGALHAGTLRGRAVVVPDTA
jgi:propanol-preferring alcohol dehydrogenase